MPCFETARLTLTLTSGLVSVSTRSLTINKIPYAGDVALSVRSIGGFPFFQIDIPFNDGFTPVPGKTVRLVHLNIHLVLVSVTLDGSIA